MNRAWQFFYAVIEVLIAFAGIVAFIRLMANGLNRLDLVGLGCAVIAFCAISKLETIHYGRVTGK